MEGITNSVDVNLSKLLEIVKDREACHAAVHGSQRVGQQYQCTYMYQLGL